MKRSKTVDEFFENLEEWEEELEILRSIMRETELLETIKWGSPVYTIDGKHVVGIGAFKSYFGLWFFQGALLKDRHQKLINAQKGRTKAMRQWRFDSLEAIDRKLVLEYVAEAARNARAGIEIKPDRNKPLVIPDILKEVFDVRPAVQDSFDQLTLTKKREFAEFIQDAKMAVTKKRRLDKIVPLILQKKGLNDKYR